MRVTLVRKALRTMQTSARRNSICGAQTLSKCLLPHKRIMFCPRINWTETLHAPFYGTIPTMCAMYGKTMVMQPRLRKYKMNSNCNTIIANHWCRCRVIYHYHVVYHILQCTTSTEWFVYHKLNVIFKMWTGYIDIYIYMYIMLLRFIHIVI